jgi:hypothetical protein
VFKKKKQQRDVNIEYQVRVIDAEAVNIKKTGSYILQVDNHLPGEILNQMLKTLKKETGAKWIIVQGGGVKVVTNV